MYSRLRNYNSLSKQLVAPLARTIAAAATVGHSAFYGTAQQRLEASPAAALYAAFAGVGSTYRTGATRSRAAFSIKTLATLWSSSFSGGGDDNAGQLDTSLTGKRHSGSLSAAAADAKTIDSEFTAAKATAEAAGPVRELIDTKWQTCVDGRRGVVADADAERAFLLLQRRFTLSGDATGEANGERRVQHVEKENEEDDRSNSHTNMEKQSISAKEDELCHGEEESALASYLENEVSDGELLRFFCVCAPGLEYLLVKELLALRLTAPSPQVSNTAEIHTQSQRHLAVLERNTAAAAAAAAAANAMRIIDDSHMWYTSSSGTSSSTKRRMGGGVEVEGTWESLWNVCMCSRLTESVRIRVGQPFLASREEVLLKRACRLPWEKFLPLVADLPEPEFSIRVHRSRLYHTKMLQQLVSSAIKQRQVSFLNQTRRDSLPPTFKGRALEGSQSMPARVHMMLDGGICQLSIEAGGQLSRRLWRVSRGPTPLKEPLAAAVAYCSPFLRLLHEKERLFVWDPFCGTGSILLEMLGIAAGIPPNSPRRRHPFFSFPSHSASRFAAFLDCITLDPHPNLGNLELFGSDIDVDQIMRANENLKAFKERKPRSVEQAYADENLPCKISFQHCDFVKAENFIPPGTLLVTNLPYGRRRDGRIVDKIYRDFRRIVASRDDWAGVYALTASSLYRAEDGMNWRVISRFSNGGIEASLLRYSKRTAKDYAI